MTIYDAHCHIFNARILGSLAKEASTDDSATRDVGSWWDWISELAYGIVSSERANNKFVLKSLKARFPNQDCATIPLMMDLSYANNKTLKAGQDGPGGGLRLDGIRSQVHALRSLSSRGNCYPFFAVDPRRPGLIDAILDGEFITQSPGGFYGIKLYPRLGFHPLSGDLPALYRYCAMKGIPITTHCSTGGFWSSDHVEMCNPENFRPALMAHGNLKINFAHWGNGSTDWMNSILSLMRNHSNVYADLSSYGSPKDLPGFKKALWGHQIVKERTLYGSDYNMVYFTQGGIGLDGYIKSFIDNFSVDELAAMMSSNPEAFLKGFKNVH